MTLSIMKLKLNNIQLNMEFDLFEKYISILSVQNLRHVLFLIIIIIIHYFQNISLNRT